jgi:SOS-response transcriptional repressor LexA
VLDGADLNAVVISGNGYLNANVCDGDCLIVRRDLAVQRGCHVVVIDDQKQVVICRVLNDSGSLQAIAPAGRTVSSTNQVVGVITGVIRRFTVPQSAVARPSA